MSRIVVLILFLLLLVGGVYYLSTIPAEQPTSTVEVEIGQGGNAQ